VNVTRRTALTTAAMSGVALVAGVSSAHAEPHPKIKQAIHALEAAKDDMQHAAHDFGGHRVDALHACDEALRQLHLALDWANHH
jgi:hypothetical protein